MKIYHVTARQNLVKILAGGLQTFQTSNWTDAAGNRQGDGSICAFRSHKDAIRWAAKMDWELYKQTGSCQIAILTLEINNFADYNWQVDDADPLTQAAYHDDWLKTRKRIPAEAIITIEFLTQDLVKTGLGFKIGGR